ncbi:MAG: hypothetical protein SF182_03650 [Deltaproteobacteria bacterium]|nr:hypothetical protein [Deltaproteobacteria bacterium]
MINSRDDLREWVEELFDALHGADLPAAQREAAIEAATDVLANKARSAGLLYGRDWSTWLDERGETALIEHLTAAQ